VWSILFAAVLYVHLAGFVGASRWGKEVTLEDRHIRCAQEVEDRKRIAELLRLTRPAAERWGGAPEAPAIRPLPAPPEPPPVIRITPSPPSQMPLGDPPLLQSGSLTLLRFRISKIKKKSG